MNKDIRLATTFFHHRKTKKLFRSLGDHGVICLLKLWTRVALEKPSGILTNWDIDDIELEADYGGETGLFVEQLISLGFMEEVDGVFILHNWEDRQEWVCKSEERGNKARLSRMAKTHKEIYSELINKGVTSITRDEYVALTNRQRSVNVSLTPAPAPSPSPEPKDNNSLSKVSPLDVELSKFLSDSILAHSPTVKIKTQSWPDTFRLMRERDNRNPDDIRQIIIFATTDDFWKANILSAAKLRKQYDQLAIKAKGQRAQIITKDKILAWGIEK